MTTLRQHAHRLLTPALVVDLGAVERNAAAMMRATGGRWRPHVKTVKQARVVEALLGAGVSSFKCATLDEAALVVEEARRCGKPADVLLAYALSRPAAGVAALELLPAAGDGSVRLLADSPAHLAALGQWLAEAGAPPASVSVLLDVNVGMNRAGTDAAGWGAPAELPMSAGAARVDGVHAYDGHIAWDARAEAHAGYDAAVRLARGLAVPPSLVVTSGTHSFKHALEHAGLGGGPWLHQVSPGTVVLSDLRSADAAAAVGLEQAAFVATRVVSTPGARRITLDAGSKALNPDRPAPGCAVVGMPHVRCGVASEEHRPAEVDDDGHDVPAFGDLLLLEPEHVCTTVNLYRDVVYVRDGEFVGAGKVEAMSRRAPLL